MSIAIYGGAFDPPHLGHVEAVRTVLRQLSPRRLLVLPDRVPFCKEKSGDGPTDAERLLLCRLAFEEFEGVEVSDRLFAHEGKRYTADTLLELHEEYPGEELILVLGADHFLTLENWYRFHEILSSCTVAVLPRAEEDEPLLLEQKERLETDCGARVRLLTHEVLPLSSTELRALLPRRMGEGSLPEKVYSEIIRRRYYGAQPELSWLRERSLGFLKPTRIEHVLGCESEAVRLADRWGEDPEKAAEAAILHDITKRLSIDEQLKLCEKYGIIVSQAELNCPSVLHAMTGAAFAREQFGVGDEVCGAIRWHTTGRPDMTLLEKIIYLADMVEPTRSFPSVGKLRELCYESLDEAMAAALECCLRFIRQEGGVIYQDTLDAAAWYAQTE